MPDRDLQDLERSLGHSFENKSLLEQAVTHASATVGACTDNERLEFLGDAVVALAVNDHLYRLFTKCEEGILTEIKSAVVSASALAKRCRVLGLNEYARMGRGMPDDSGLSDSVLANLFEAVIGALYLDAGFEYSKGFIIGQLESEIEATAENRGGGNHKAALQRAASIKYGELPRYRLVSETGPDHQKVFTVEALIKDRTFPAASGRTKKEAEQGAAANALQVLGSEVNRDGKTD
jgi:ribonuclease-3